jgi:hypothetical protein
LFGWWTNKETDMKRIAILTLLATLASLSAGAETRVFEFKYARPSEVARLVNQYGSGIDDQRKVWVFEGTKEQADKIAEIVKRFDVPPPPVPNVEVTIYIMSALGQPSAVAVPAELDGVVKQLKAMFSYKAYQLIDTQVIRVRAGLGGDSSGVVDNGSAVKTVSQAKFKSASISTDEKGVAIRIDGLKVGMKIPVPLPAPNKGPTAVKEFQYLDTGISTDVDVHEGQKYVVGKANMDGSDRASIVVLTAKVVE